MARTLQLQLAAFLGILLTAGQLCALDIPAIVDANAKRIRDLPSIQFSYTDTYKYVDHKTKERRERTVAYQFFYDGSRFAFHGDVLTGYKGRSGKIYFTRNDEGFQLLAGTSTLFLTRDVKQLDREANAFFQTLPFIAASSFLFHGESLSLDSLKGPAVWADFANRARIISETAGAITIAVDSVRDLSYTITFEKPSLLPTTYFSSNPQGKAMTSIKYAAIKAGEKRVSIPIFVAHRFKDPKGADFKDATGADLDLGTSVAVDEKSILIDQPCPKEIFSISWSQAPVVFDKDAGLPLKVDVQQVVGGK